MLTSRISVPASDLWSLGVLIYRMYCGVHPFSGQIEALVYKKILSLEYSWPTEFQVPPHAKDLIEQLLKIDPMQRLGAGAPGTSNDFKSLMAHPYFDGLDFSRIHQMKVPLTLPQSIIDENTQDNPVKTNKKQLSQNKMKLIVKEGFLLKRNEWHWKQKRYFILQFDG